MPSNTIYNNNDISQNGNFERQTVHNNHNQVRFPSSSTSPMQRFAPIQNLLHTESPIFSQTHGMLIIRFYPKYQG